MQILHEEQAEQLNTLSHIVFPLPLLTPATQASYSKVF